MEMAPRLSPEVLRGVLDLVPDEWLQDESGFEGAEEVRAAYAEYLTARLVKPRPWVRALDEARGKIHE
ncbi:MAG: hypothetical protein H0X23_05640 [Rubrobacter sp.]|jgi:hypothetical protein|nr:hypothetical protein [Rubrobacter sp.]